MDRSFRQMHQEKTPKLIKTSGKPSEFRAFEKLNTLTKGKDKLINSGESTRNICKCYINLK